MVELHRGGQSIVPGGIAIAVFGILILPGSAGGDLGAALAPTTSNPLAGLTFGSSGALKWTQISTGSNTPTGRAYASSAYDTADRFVVLFGGGVNGPNYTWKIVNDTWTFHAGSWTKVSASTAPSPRLDPSMAYDPTTRSVILFGGWSVAASSRGCSGNSSMTPCNDTWSFSHGTWRLLHPLKRPPARDAAAIAYDPRISALVIGGGGGNTGNGWSGAFSYHDMWSYANRTWTQIPPKGALSFPNGCPMAYDWRAQSLLCVPMGNRSGIVQTWTYNSTGWHWHATRTQPTSSVDSALTFDPALQMAVLYGTSWGPQGTWGYLWGKWTNLTNGTQPPGIGAPAMVWDPSDGYVVLFGGQGIYGYLYQQTWKLT